MLQDTNAQVEQLEDSVLHWKREYKSVYQKHMELLASLCCEHCHAFSKGELCESCTPKPQIAQQPSTSKGKSSAASSTKPTTSKYHQRLEELCQELAGKIKPKVKREVESLTPLQGWEDWAKGKKLRRKLEYNDDDED